jgi:hypothetical protein
MGRDEFRWNSLGATTGNCGARLVFLDESLGTSGFQKSAICLLDKSILKYALFTEVNLG